MTLYFNIACIIGVLLVFIGVYLAYYQIKNPSSIRESLREISFLGIKIKSKMPFLVLVLGVVLVVSPPFLTFFMDNARTTLDKDHNLSVVPPPKEYQVLPVASLEPPDYRPFEIIKDIRVVDLRSRKKVADEDADKKVSPVTWVRYTLLKKKFQTMKIGFQFATTGSGLDPRCITHPYVLKKLNEPSLMGGNKLKVQWEVEVDIGEYDIGEEFVVITEATYWNAFTGEKKEWASIMADQDSREIGMVLLFPDCKPYKNYELKTQKKGSEKKEDFCGNWRVYSSPTRQSLAFYIFKPKIDVNYRLEWQWQD